MGIAFTICLLLGLVLLCTGASKEPSIGEYDSGSFVWSIIMIASGALLLLVALIIAVVAIFT